MQIFPKTMADNIAESNPIGRLEFLDFAKGFAIFSVVLLHFTQPYAEGIWGRVVLLGGTGVHLFFLASGFGLGLRRGPILAVPFYKRNLSKILLPYYVVVTFSYLVNSLVFPYFGQHGAYSYFGHILLYKMFDERIIGSLGYQFWFISTIIQLYIIFPLSFRLMLKLGEAPFFLAALFLSTTYWLGLAIFNLGGERVFGSFFLQYFWEFALGMVLAQMYKQGRLRNINLPKRILLLWALIGIGLMACLAIMGGQFGKIFNDIPAAFGFTSGCGFCMLILKQHAPSLYRFGLILGRFSYSLYLVHMLVFLVTMKTLQGINFPGSPIFGSIIVALPISILIAMIYDKLTSMFLVRT